MVSSVIFLVDLVGTERWVVWAPFISGMSRRTFWLVLLHSEYNWQWYRNETWDWMEEKWEGVKTSGDTGRKRQTSIKMTPRYLSESSTPATICWLKLRLLHELGAKGLIIHNFAFRMIVLLKVKGWVSEESFRFTIHPLLKYVIQLHSVKDRYRLKDILFLIFSMSYACMSLHELSGQLSNKWVLCARDYQVAHSLTCFYFVQVLFNVPMGPENSPIISTITNSRT